LRVEIIKNGKFSGELTIEENDENDPSGEERTKTGDWDGIWIYFPLMGGANTWLGSGGDLHYGTSEKMDIDDFTGRVGAAEKFFNEKFELYDDFHPFSIFSTPWSYYTER